MISDSTIKMGPAEKKKESKIVRTVICQNCGRCVDEEGFFVEIDKCRFCKDICPF